MNELAHLPDFFDEAAAGFENAQEALLQLLLELRLPADDRAGVADATVGVSSRLHTTMMLHRRMGLRLPVDHEINAAYWAALAALHERYTGLTGAAKDPDAEVDEAKDDEIQRAAMGYWREVVDCARRELERRGGGGER